jgi:hypothetical protein
MSVSDIDDEARSAWRTRITVVVFCAARLSAAANVIAIL